MPLENYIFWALTLFIIGLTGLVSTQFNLIFMLLAIELIILSANIIFIVSSVFFSDVSGHLFALFILTVAAAESSIGLALLIVFFKSRGTIAYPFVNLIKG